VNHWPPKGGKLLKHIELVQTPVFAFLLFDVLTNSLLVSAYGGHELPSGPEARASEVLLSPKERPCNVDGALALDVAHHLSNRVLLWDRDKRVVSYTPANVKGCGSFETVPCPAAFSRCAGKTTA